jgi:hypothetical protein
MGSRERTGAHDGQVVLRQRRGGYHSETRRHILQRGWSKPDPVRQNAYGQQAGIHLTRSDKCSDPLGIIEIDPLIRDAVAAQEVTDGVSDRRCPVPYQDDLGSDGPSVVIEHRYAVRGPSHDLKDASARQRRGDTAPTTRRESVVGGVVVVNGARIARACTGEPGFRSAS